MITAAGRYSGRNRRHNRCRMRTVRARARVVATTVARFVTFDRWTRDYVDILRSSRYHLATKFGQEALDPEQARRTGREGDAIFRDVWVCRVLSDNPQNFGRVRRRCWLQCATILRATDVRCAVNNLGSTAAQSRLRHEFRQCHPISSTDIWLSNSLRHQHPGGASASTGSSASTISVAPDVAGDYPQ